MEDVTVLSPMSRWDVGVDVSSGRCVKVVCASSLPADVLWNIIHILDVRVLYKYMYASGRVSYRYGALLKYTTTQASESRNRCLYCIVTSKPIVLTSIIVSSLQ